MQSRLIDETNEAFHAIERLGKASARGISKTPSASSSRKGIWTGRVMSTLAVLFLLFDSVGKLLRLTPVVEGTTKIGFPVAAIVPIGIVLLACTTIYLIPRTAILGAILLTGYLGGAIATQVRVGAPLFGYVLFPIYFAALIWGGLFLRDARTRALLASR
jgi:hypothetical protein